MNIQIEFFKDNFIDAIDAGIYEIDVKYNDKSEVLYIGESVNVLKRCATHLYKLKKKSEYFGFTKDNINDEKVTLVFSLIRSQGMNNAEARKGMEKELIRSKKPIMQSGISDRMKSIPGKKKALTKFLNK